MLRKIGYATVVAAAAMAFVLGSAATGEAKSKKKMQAAPPPQPTCMFTAASPVCGEKGGVKFNYKNACYAANDGAKLIKSGACPAKKAMMHGMKKSKKKAMKKKM